MSVLTRLLLANGQGLKPSPSQVLAAGSGVTLRHGVQGAVFLFHPVDVLRQGSLFFAVLLGGEFVEKLRRNQSQRAVAIFGADKTTNYTLTGGLRLVGITRLSDSQYRLYTTYQTPGALYTLTVKSAVKDRAGNPIHPSYCSRSFLGGRMTGTSAWQLYR